MPLRAVLFLEKAPDSPEWYVLGGNACPSATTKWDGRPEVEATFLRPRFGGAVASQPRKRLVWRARGLVKAS